MRTDITDSPSYKDEAFIASTILLFPPCSVSTLTNFVYLLASPGPAQGFFLLNLFSCMFQGQALDFCKASESDLIVKNAV